MPTQRLRFTRRTTDEFGVTTLRLHPFGPGEIFGFTPSPGGQLKVAGVRANSFPDAAPGDEYELTLTRIGPGPAPAA